MKEIYEQNAYIQDFEASVIQCLKKDNQYGVILDQTAFYPEGGGQPSDQGILNDIEVFDVQKEEEGIVHYTKEPIEVGTKVRGQIDWARRFDLMQNHTGEHIVSGLVHSIYGYDNVGFHMGDHIQVDFNGSLTKEDIQKVEQLANKIVYDNIAIEELFPSKEELEKIEYRSKKELTGEVRIIKIGDADCCACCGTHVKTTGEIGIIKILSLESVKKGSRIEMISGQRALNELNVIFNQNQQISQLLSAPMSDTANYVQKVVNEVETVQQKRIELQKEVFAHKVNDFENDLQLIVDFEDDVDRTSLRYLGNELLEKKNATIVAVLTKEEEGWWYYIMSKEKKLKDIAKVLNERLGGKGGGSDEMIQGLFNADAGDIQIVLNEVLGSL